MHLLRDQCLACHNAEKKKGGLVMTSRESVLKGSDDGEVVTPGAPDASLLFKALQPDADPHMPPKKQLSTNQIEIMREWIADGLRWDEAAIRSEGRRPEAKLRPMPPSYVPSLALALAPDGRLLAVGRGERVVIHDTSATNFPVVASFGAHSEAVRALAWSPDGRRLASGAYRELTVWDTNGFKALWTVRTGLSGRVSAVRFSAHGGALAAADSSAAESGWIRLFDSETGRALAGWAAHTDSIYDLALSPEGGVLASAGGDKLVKVWELISQREIARLEAHSGAVTGMAFNTNGTELASVSADKQLKIWNIKSRESTVSMSGRKRGFNAAAWSADGRVLAAVDDDGGLFSFSNFKQHTGEQSSGAADERQLGRWPEPLHAAPARRALGRRARMLRLRPMLPADPGRHPR